VHGDSEIPPLRVLVSEYWHRIPAVCVSRLLCVSEKIWDVSCVRDIWGFHSDENFTAAVSYDAV
jgi:hypothetical protein